MKKIKNINFILLMFALIILSACSKKDSCNHLFIYQSGGDVDTSVPLAYDVFPKSNQLKVIWEEESDSYYTDLSNFEATNDLIKISYQDKEERNQTKTFEILSDSVVQDETEIEFEWFGNDENE